MRRNIVQTVTMPILIEASSGTQIDDWGTFYPTGWRGSAFVHVVTEQDVKSWIKEDLSKKDTAVLTGLSHLKYGIEEEDEYTLTKGHELLQPFVKDLVPLKVEQREIRISDKISMRFDGRQEWSASIYNYSGWVTEYLKNSRFVVWGAVESYGRFLPALYCRDKRTAVFAMRFVGNLRICPRCDLPFVPSAGNIDYCQPAHREAHRVARSRWNKKQKDKG